nr:MAG TPA: hypothetical protein [Caudoviricetes sp.]
MNKKCETIVIQECNYETYEDYKRAIIDLIDTLIKNDYVVVVRQEINNMIIEYNFIDENLSDSRLVWLGCDEYVMSDVSEEGDKDEEY